MSNVPERYVIIILCSVELGKGQRGLRSTSLGDLCLWHVFDTVRKSLRSGSLVKTLSIFDD